MGLFAYMIPCINYNMALSARGKNMASPAVPTFPDVEAAATYRQITLQVIDASGDKDAVGLLVPVGTTVAQVNTIAETYQDITQASVYGVISSLFWEGDADPDNADTQQRNSNKDGINLLFKDITTRMTAPVRVVAPIPAVLQGNQDIPLLSNADMIAFITAVLAAKPSFDFQRAQYTERRERANNPVIR